MLRKSIKQHFRPLDTDMNGLKNSQKNQGVFVTKYFLLSNGRKWLETYFEVSEQYNLVFFNSFYPK